MREDKKWLDEDWPKKTTLQEFFDDTETTRSAGLFGSSIYDVVHPRGKSKVFIGFDPRYNKIAAQIHMELENGEVREDQTFLPTIKTLEEQELAVKALVLGVALGIPSGIYQPKTA